MAAAGTRTIDLVYFNAGGGHRAAALALAQVALEERRRWQIRLVDLSEVLDPVARLRRRTGVHPEDFYNKRLAKGWTIGLRQELKLLQTVIRLSHRTIRARLERHWAATRPDMVVSLVPNFNRALCESVAACLPGVPFVTVMTDMADLPPHFWIEPGQRQYLVCGTPQALRQAREAGYADEYLRLTTGMIIAPSFYADGQVSREEGLRELGLDPAKPTGLVSFGAQGSMKMLGIARALQDRQLVMICGHNRVLNERLRDLPSNGHHAVFGFTRDIARLMALSDYFIGKPGPASLSEAVHAGLPVITFGNAWTMPQERYNVDWVREQGVGVVVKSVRSLDAACERLLADLGAYKARVGRLRNVAVFEIPQIFDEILVEAAWRAGSAEQRQAQEARSEHDDETDRDRAGLDARAA